MAKRDADTIALVLSQLEHVWNQMPDLRLGQLIQNVINAHEGDVNLYYVEDSALIRAIKGYYHE